MIYQSHCVSGYHHDDIGTGDDSRADALDGRLNCIDDVVASHALCSEEPSSRCSSR